MTYQGLGLSASDKKVDQRHGGGASQHWHRAAGHPLGATNAPVNLTAHHLQAITPGGALAGRLGAAKAGDGPPWTGNVARRLTVKLVRHV